MTGEITNKERGLPDRDLWKFGTEKQVFRFQRPDGTTYETSFGGENPRWSAEAWANIMGHKLLTEKPVQSRQKPTQPIPDNPKESEKAKLPSSAQEPIKSTPRK